MKKTCEYCGEAECRAAGQEEIVTDRGGLVVRMYQIYGLIDPRSRALVYVGRSADAEARLRSHLQEASLWRAPGARYRGKVRWLNELQDSGMVPGLEIVDLVEVPTHLIYCTAYQRLFARLEMWWVGAFLNAGYALSNIIKATPETMLDLSGDVPPFDPMDGVVIGDHARQVGWSTGWWEARAGWYDRHEERSAFLDILRGANG